jgi:hypothetical protein
VRKLQDQLALKHALVHKRDLKSIVLDQSMNKSNAEIFHIHLGPKPVEPTNVVTQKKRK